MKTEYAYAAFNVVPSKTTINSGSDSITLTITYIGESLQGAEVYTSIDQTPTPITGNSISINSDKLYVAGNGTSTIFIKSTKVPDYIKTIKIKSN
jgi:hypothetical protein